MTDPIADMLTRIRNALMVKKQAVSIPFSKIKLEMARIMKEEGFIEDFKKEENGHAEILVSLKYQKEGRPAIEKLRRISKPGRRVYANRQQMPRVLNDIGIAIMSTSKGIMTNKEARRQKVGGEVLCEIY